jgi:hypothetical protein
MIDFSQKILLQEDTLLREVKDEAVLLNLSTESYYTLNAVGARMLQTLTNSASIEQAYRTLLSDYDADNAVLKTDLQELIEQLLEHGLVVFAS